MKRALALFALTLAPPAFAAPVDLPVNVADGATWTITTERIREDVRGGAPRRVESHARYKATYRAAGEEQILVLELLDGSMGGDAPGNLPMDQLKAPIELEVDEALAPVRLADWPKLRAAVYAAIDGATPDPKARELARTVFEPLGAEQAANIMLPHMSLLGLGQGLALDPKAPHRYQSELPNPLGGPAVAADAILAIDPASAKGARPIVTWTQTLNPQALAATMRASLDALLAKAATPEQLAEVQSAAKDLSVTRQDRCRFEIDEPSGLAVKTECSTELKMRAGGQDISRTDRWTIIQSLPEKR